MKDTLHSSNAQAANVCTPEHALLSMCMGELHTLRSHS